MGRSKLNQTLREVRGGRVDVPLCAQRDIADAAYRCGRESHLQLFRLLSSLRVVYAVKSQKYYYFFSINFLRFAKSILKKSIAGLNGHYHDALAGFERHRRQDTTKVYIDHPQYLAPLCTQLNIRTGEA
jgi:hypothetical protein